MPESITISKQPSSKISMNWQQLREEGIKRLEKLGTKFWTDFNLHDPGITMLEVLCYALTDLGYRTNFPIEDLLAREKADDQKNFYEAREILHVNPVTEMDLRKLIIDTLVIRENNPLIDDSFVENCGEFEPRKRMRAIKNAWLSKACPEPDSNFPPLYLHQTYQFTDEVVDLLEKLIGNYLRRQEIYNKVIFQSLITETGTGDIASFQEFIRDCQLVVREIFDKRNNAALHEKKYCSAQEFIEEVKCLLEEERDGALSDIELRESELCLLARKAHRTEFLNVSDDLENGSNPDCYCQFNIKGSYQICIELMDNIDPFDAVVVDQVKEAVRRNLHAHRNLCEDFLDIQVVQAQKIGLCAEIETLPGFVMEEVLAEVFYSIQEFLTPTIRFYSLRELLARGMSCEDIFNGPPLRNGFLLDSDLEKGDLKTVIYRSDILQVIMDVEGVKNVRFLRIRNCDGKVLEPVEEGEEWCLKVNTDNGKYKPILDLDCSEVLFKVESFVFTPDKEDAKEKLALIRHLRQDGDTDDVSFEIDYPRGRVRELTAYTSIQNEFPLVYHIGEEGLPPTASPLRKAQAKQLKAYLLFFDQLLANYLMQLKEVKNLLSIDQKGFLGDLVIGETETGTPPTPTYFHQALTPEIVPGLEELLDLESLMTENAESGTGSGLSDFAETGTILCEEGYPTSMEGIIESDTTRQNRRGKLLDHLLARFGEVFTDYSLLAFTGLNQKNTPTQTINEILLGKATFLECIPELGRERGKAFDCLGGRYVSMIRETTAGLNLKKISVWNSDNVSGLKKRVSKYLGFDDFLRKTLTCLPDFDTEVNPIIQGGSIQCYVYNLVDKRTRTPLIGGAKEYKLKRNAQRAAKILFDLALNEANFFIERNPAVSVTDPDPNKDKIFKLKIKNRNNVTVAETDYLSLTEVEDRQTAILSLAYPEDCEVNGFHLVEHVLLRPWKEDDFLLLQPFCIGDDCYALDPYSFWITVIAPSWQERFQDPNSRLQFEQVVRRETPSHIGVRFLYVNNTDMYDFEMVYKRWLEEKVKEDPNERELANHMSAVVEFLNDHKDDCPIDPGAGRATLDCRQPATGN